MNDYEAKLEAKRQRLHDAADAVGTAGISSDDPEAIAKLKDKLHKLEAERDSIKAHNKNVRARRDEPGNEMADRQTVPTWRLTNLGATIRETKKRIEGLKRELAQRASVPSPVVSTTYGDVTVAEHFELNRIAIKFPGKPSIDVLARLKSEGWHFNRRGDLMLCWTRMLTDAARNSVKYVIAPTAHETPRPHNYDDQIVASLNTLRKRIGATVTVDGGYRAVIRDVFPEGSTSYPFPHYKIDYFDGDKGVAIGFHRVHVPIGPEEYVEVDGERMRACICSEPQPRFMPSELAVELPGQIGKLPPCNYCDACFRPVRSAT